jgi:cytochrome c
VRTKSIFLTLLLAATLGLSGVQLACTQLSSSELRAVKMMTGGGDALAGRTAIRRYGCNDCHEIRGIEGARARVGPPLTGIASRYYLAGEIPNTPENLEHWIQHPHQIEPHTLMPEMGVTDQDSRDIAAYLYTLR